MNIIQTISEYPKRNFVSLEGDDSYVTEVSVWLETSLSNRGKEVVFVEGEIDISYLDSLVKEKTSVCVFVFKGSASDQVVSLKLANFVISARRPGSSQGAAASKYYRFISSYSHLHGPGSDKSMDMNLYRHFNKCEEKYLSLLRKVVNSGTYVVDRTGVGCYQKLGKCIGYNIESFRLPLFTHRKMFLRGIVEELLFFISGKTDTTYLSSKNINIWKPHTSKEWLDSRGLNYKEGCYGPSYGFQLRHWGADFRSNDPDGTIEQYEGIDQLKYIVDSLKSNPSSRRILFSYWNPSVIEQCALPSCHLLYQFHVENGFLSCSFYQRSNDFALAGNFNIVSASLLTMMLCKVTGLLPKKVYHMIGNVHVYANQVESIKQFYKRTASPSPYVQLLERESLEDYIYSDFKVIHYYPDSKESIPMTA